MDFCVRPGNQTPDQSVELFDMVEAEESKTFKGKNQSHVDYVIQYEEHCSQRFLASGTNDQSARSQGGSYGVCFA